jgi:1,4-dihydroxy-2-naphthoyl-CoA hydrolase
MTQLREDITLEILNQRSGDNLPGLLGVELTDLQPLEVHSRMKLKSIHFAPNTYLHAASVIALADTTCGYATVAHLSPGATSFTTIELKSNFLGTTRGSEIRCVARAQHLGKNTQVWDAEVFDAENDKKIALFRCSQMILWPKSKESK